MLAPVQAAEPELPPSSIILHPHPHHPPRVCYFNTALTSLHVLLFYHVLVVFDRFYKNRACPRNLSLISTEGKTQKLRKRHFI